MSQWDANDQGFCRTTEKQAETSELDTSIEEWREALEIPNHTPGYTIAELSEKLQTPESTLRRRLRKLIRDGKCSLGAGRRTSTNGRLSNVIVYQLKE